MLCEVLVYDRQLSAVELDAMHLHLAGKYDLAVAALPPSLQVRLAAAASLAISWESTYGRAYQLQTATTLPGASWLNLGAPFPGTGSLITTNFPIGPEPVKFFRLQSGN